MHGRQAAEARNAQTRTLRRALTAAAVQDGFTLSEMLVVLAILGTILAGLTTLFTSALKSQTDQTNRAQAQQDARLGLDKLRREIRCASDVTTPSGYPASSVTITLGSYCPTAGGAATVTWCTKDKNGNAPPAAGAQPYTLWRYVGSSCSGTGTSWASNLVDKIDSPTVAAGKIFDSLRVPAAASPPTSQATGGTLGAGSYSYVVTAVLPSGAEVPGTTASVTIASGLTNQVSVPLPSYAGAASFNVYGRDGSGVRLLKNVTSGPYLDTGPTSLTGNPLTLPASGSTTIGVASTSNFSAVANTITFGASGVVTCTGTNSTPPSFTGCSGGQAGQYAQGTPVFSASSTRPPRAMLSVVLPLDLTPASTSQRFVLVDNITLRNGRPY